jgi:hypothetical protein
MAYALKGAGLTLADDTSVISAAGALVAPLAVVHGWTANQYSTQDTLTSTAAHVAVNLALGNELYHNITEDSAVDNPTNIVAGMRWSLTVEADGSHELTWGTYYKWGGTTGVCPDVSAMTDGQLVAIDCKAHSATVILCAASETYTP